MVAPKARQNTFKIRRWRLDKAGLLAGIVLAALLPRSALSETMEAALAKAYENNPQLNAQRAIVRQSDEGVSQALSGYRPTITANASVGREYTNTKQEIPRSEERRVGKECLE